MGDNEYRLNGFIFTDPIEYNEAKKEAESIEYIKANNDLNDINNCIKLYQKLVERRTLRTMIGFTFLKDLQNRILKEGIIKEDSLPYICIEKKANVKRFNGSEKELEKKHQEVLDNYHIKLRNSRLIAIFLMIIILVMMGLAIFSDRTKFSNYEKQILNKYSAWEEDLDAREKALKEKID